MITVEQEKITVDNIIQEISGLKCNLFINNYEVIINNIMSIEIRSWFFDRIPRLSITLKDDHLFHNLSYLNDQTVIELRFSSSQEDSNEKIYYFDLDCYDFSRVYDVATINISAVLKGTNVHHPIVLKSFSKKNSIEVIGELASSMGFGFNKAKNLNPNDRMTWIQTVTNFDMLKYVEQKSSLNDDVAIVYIDLDGVVHYNSLKNAIDNETVTRLEYKLELFQCKTPEAVENYKKQFNTPEKYGHFYGIEVTNISKYANLISGYGEDIVWLDYDTGELKTKNVSGNIPLLTKTDNSKAHKNSVVSWNKLDVQPDHVHKKWFEAEIVNEYMKASFFNQMLMTAVNYHCELNLLDKVYITIPSWIENDSLDINEKYSGYYLVGGKYIKFDLSKGSILPTQTLALFRPGSN